MRASLFFQSAAPVLLFAATMAVPGRAEAPVPQAAFHAIGSVNSTIVRDATRVGPVIFAVGSSLNPATNSIEATLWTLDGVNPVSATALPNFVNGAGNVTAEAITPDAAYMASQARDTGGVSATRVTTSGLLNLNLSTAPYTAFNRPASARTISDNGQILYGTANPSVQVTSSTNTIINANRGRAVRYDVASGTSALINPVPAAADLQANPVQQQLIQRAASSDGSVVLGWNFKPLNGTPVDQAFRYTNDGNGNSTVTAIARIATGGTWNRPLALSGNGQVALLFGNSTAHPGGEVYQYDATTGAITLLGSPNKPWTTDIGGITDDGAVAALSMSSSCINPCAPSRYAYFHNGNGWFHLTTALAAAGVDLGGAWGDLLILGMNGDGTLVYGAGLHNGVQEGFIAEFASNYLKDFAVPAVAPADSRIVGAWSAGGDTIITLQADGTYFQMEAGVPASESDAADGFERGTYTWNPVSGAFTATTRLDTNGAVGLSGLNSQSGITASLAGDTLTFAIAGCVPDPDDPCVYPFSRVAGGPSSLVGGWSLGDATAQDNSVVLVLLDNGAYYLAQDGSSLPPPDGDPNGWDGLEVGTWLWNAVTGDFTATAIVDTNGQWGLSHPLSPLMARLSPDQMRLLVTEGPEVVSVNRIAVATAATPTGANVVVAPTSSTGTTPVTVAFSDVTGGGETTLQVLDPAAVESPEPPPGFALGDPPLYYELETTATFTGPVTVCFDYGGVTFATGAPRLLHFDANLLTWVDITTSVDTANAIICGLTSTFSPFAVAATAAAHGGFARPISPIGGYQNVVKGGSTVPLKFNVFVNGVEKTDTAGLFFSVVKVGCETGTGEVPIEFVTTGGTSLRYGSGQFIQNWKTPSAAGCYYVRVTGDGLLISALFRVR